MNYQAIAVLNGLSGGKTTFTATISQIIAAFQAANSGFDSALPNVLTTLQGAFEGWSNNLTSLSDGAYTSAMSNITGATVVTFTQAPGWKYIFPVTTPPAA